MPCAINLKFRGHCKSVLPICLWSLSELRPVSVVGSTGDPAVAKGAVEPVWKAGHIGGVAAAALHGKAAAAAYGWYIP